MATLDGQAGFTGVLAAALVASLDVAARILRDRCGTWSVSFLFLDIVSRPNGNCCRPPLPARAPSSPSPPADASPATLTTTTLDHDTVHLTTLRLNRHGPSRTCHSHAGADR